jgi:hypothetical protein
MAEIRSNGRYRALRSGHGTTFMGVRREKAALFQWVEAPPGELAPAGSNRGSHGGNEMAEAGIVSQVVV